MPELSPRRVVAVLFLGIFSGSLIGTPLAPVDHRVSDTASSIGEPGSSGAPGGISPHPHFRVRYIADGSLAPAVQMRVQLSASVEFSEPLWDSGFVAITPVRSSRLTGPIPYSGPSLELGATYYWRAAIRDDQSVAGPYSAEPAIFQVTEMDMACDLRAATGLGSEIKQGNPTLTVTATPGLSAEYQGNGEVSFLQVQASFRSDLSDPFWTSDWQNIPGTSAGGRAETAFSGPSLDAGRAVFWQARFASDTEAPMPWSQCRASFVYDPVQPGALAPGGFGMEDRTFGNASHSGSDLALANVDGNNAIDAIIAAGEEGQAHLVYPDIGASNPGTPITFSVGRGGRSLLVVADFDLSDNDDLIVVDRLGLMLYLNSSYGGSVENSVI